VFDDAKSPHGLVALEWSLFVALVFYSGMNSWSSSYSAGILAGYLAGAMFVNETIDRLARRASRPRSLHR
jgi:hypothetical protein